MLLSSIKGFRRAALTPRLLSSVDFTLIVLSLTGRCNISNLPGPGYYQYGALSFSDVLLSAVSKNHRKGSYSRPRPGEGIFGIHRDKAASSLNMADGRKSQPIINTS